MAKTILDKALERFVLNAVSALGRDAGKKMLQAVDAYSKKKKRQNMKDDIADSKEDENK